MKLNQTITLLVLAMISGSALANESVEKCTSLLPNDHLYQVEVKYDFKKGSETQRFVGMTDKSEKKLTEQEKKNIQPFVDCVKQHLQ